MPSLSVGRADGSAVFAFDVRNGTQDDDATMSLQGGGMGSDRGLCPNAIPHVVAYGGNRQSGPLDVATAVNAHGGPHGRMDFESETFVAHSLRGEGFDASEDGTGRGTPLIAVPLLEIGKGSTSRGHGPNGAGFGEDGDPMFTLQAGAQHGVAVQSSQSGFRETDTHATLDANNGSRRHNGVVQQSGIRRLTPGECEKLQGYPPGWTDIEFKGKRAADGPRYQALGNAFAVPVVRWIAKRIAREHSSIAD